MSPVGGWPPLQAAIGNGADSIYLGLSAFSALSRAANFDPETELPQAVATCHDAGVKVYIALNTLVFDHELEEIEALIRYCANAKVHALIVQDLGLTKLARAVAPNLELHASTQQTVTSADGAAFCDELLDTSRIVLGRELSVTEIDSVASHLDPNVKIEAFLMRTVAMYAQGIMFICVTKLVLTTWFLMIWAAETQCFPHRRNPVLIRSMNGGNWCQLLPH